MSLEAQDAVRGSMSEKLDLTPAMEMVRNYNPGVVMDPADVSALVKKYLPPMFALIASQAAEIERLRVVCDQIVYIMATYREQEKSEWGVGTPGGLEHMGDVWELLRKWDAALTAIGKEKA